MQEYVGSGARELHACHPCHHPTAVPRRPRRSVAMTSESVSSWSGPRRARCTPLFPGSSLNYVFRNPARSLGLKAAHGAQPRPSPWPTGAMTARALPSAAQAAHEARPSLWAPHPRPRPHAPTGCAAPLGRSHHSCGARKKVKRPMTQQTVQGQRECDRENEQQHSTCMFQDKQGLSQWLPVGQSRARWPARL